MHTVIHDLRIGVFLRLFLMRLRETFDLVLMIIEDGVWAVEAAFKHALYKRGRVPEIVCHCYANWSRKLPNLSSSSSILRNWRANVGDFGLGPVTVRWGLVYSNLHVGFPFGRVETDVWMRATPISSTGWATNSIY